MVSTKTAGMMPDRATLGAGLALAVMVASFAFFMFGGGRGQLGPIDYAGIQLITIAIWVLAPVVGGLALRGAKSNEATRAALIVGGVVAGVFAIFAFGGPRADGSGFGEPAAVLGTVASVALIGLGAGAGLLATARPVRHMPWYAAASIGAAVHFATSWIGYATLYGVVPSI